MRLIDADKIEPHKQLESLGNGQYEYVRVAYMDDIDVLPTVDAVEVVRCKDCVRFRPDDDVWGQCTAAAYAIRSTDVCSYGVRKDGEQT